MRWRGTFVNDLIVDVSIYRDRITCAHDGCKHPALSILDWAITGLSPLCQDVPTPGPNGRIDSLFEVIWPIPFQHSPVVLTVDLTMKEIDKCQFPKVMKQAQASHVFPDHSDSRRQFNSCFSRLFYCSTYSVSACDISCSELCRRCVFILTMSGTQCPSSSHYRFLVSSSDAQVNKKNTGGTEQVLSWRSCIWICLRSPWQTRPGWCRRGCFCSGSPFFCSSGAEGWLGADSSRSPEHRAHTLQAERKKWEY